MQIQRTQHNVIVTKYVCRARESEQKRWQAKNSTCIYSKAWNDQTINNPSKIFFEKKTLQVV